MNAALVKLLAELGSQMLINLIKSGIDELKERSDNSVDEHQAESLKNVLDVIDVNEVVDEVKDKVVTKLVK